MQQQVTLLNPSFLFQLAHIFSISHKHTHIFYVTKWKWRRCMMFRAWGGRRQKGMLITIATHIDTHIACWRRVKWQFIFVPRPEQWAASESWEIKNNYSYSSQWVVRISKNSIEKLYTENMKNACLLQRFFLLMLLHAFWCLSCWISFALTIHENVMTIEI